MFVNTRRAWLILVIAGAAYGLIGVTFALPTTEVRFWRLAAWAVSGMVYLCHIAYEKYWLGSRALTTAAHAAMAVAIGAFLLAVGATVHAAMAPSHAPYWRFRVALVVWPIMTFVPAFMFALFLAWLLSRLSVVRVQA